MQDNNYELIIFDIMTNIVLCECARIVISIIYNKTEQCVYK